MFKIIFALCAIAAAARPAAAQVYLGAELSPGSLLKAEEAKLSRENDDAFARAFVLENSTAALYAVFESTAPEIAVSASLRRGIYRQELLILFSIAGSTGVPFGQLAKEREKGVSLRELAARYGSDLLKLFRESGERQKIIEEKAGREDALFSAAASTAPAAGAGLPAAPPQENEQK